MVVYDIVLLGTVYIICRVNSMVSIDETDKFNLDDEIRNIAYEQVDMLTGQIKKLKSEIKVREEAITSLCKRYKISAVLD